MKLSYKFIPALILLFTICLFAIGCDSKTTASAPDSESNISVDLVKTTPTNKDNSFYSKIAAVLGSKAPGYEQMEFLASFIIQRRNKIQKTIIDNERYNSLVFDSQTFTHANYKPIIKALLGNEKEGSSEDHNKLLGDLYLVTLNIEKAAKYYRIASQDSENSNLIFDAGYLSEIVGNYNYAETSYLKLKKLTDDKKPNHYPMNQVLVYLGNVCQKQGRYHDAVWYYRFSIDSYSSEYGKDRPYIATIRIKLANVHIKQGRFEDATRELNKAIPVIKQYDDEKKLKLAEAYYYLGETFYDMEKYSQALTEIKKAIEIQDKYYGREHIANAPLYSIYGLTLNALKKNEKALKYHQLALKIDKKFFGNNHRTVASSLNNIGSYYRDIGQFKRAIEYYEDSLAISSNFNKGINKDVALILNNIGESWGMLGNEKKSIEFHQKSINIYTKVTGGNHPGIALAWHNIGVSHYKLGFKAETIKSFIKAYNIYKASLGINHPKTKRTKENLAKVGHFID